MVLLATEPVIAADDTPLPQLITQLGADSFRDRKAAEAKLKTQPRDSLTPLREALKDSSDPETRMRLKRIITHIQSNPNTIPTTMTVFTSKKHGVYTKLAETYRGTASISTGHTEGNAGTSGPFAQSFIPKTDTITAVEVCTYALSGAYGWMRLDLCEDNKGKPGTIIARSWIYVPEGHRFPHSDYAFHDFIDQTVDPKATYWLTYLDVNIPKRSSNLINYGLTIKNDAYADGMHWRSFSDKPSPKEDLKFRIFNKTPKPHPGYRKPTTEEIATRPTPAEQEQIESNLKWKQTPGDNAQNTHITPFSGGPCLIR